MSGNITTTSSSIGLIYDHSFGTGTYITPNIIRVESDGNMHGSDYGSASGITGKIKLVNKPDGIHPALFFKYVKSKFTPLELATIKERIAKLRKLVVSADEMDQQALYEQFSLMLAVAIKESEAVACGYNQWVHNDSIKKFIDKVCVKKIRFHSLEQFPRTIPDKIRKKIHSVKERGIFDELWVLYTQEPDEKEIKTTKEKIKEKDPILFGRFMFNPDIFYYITDWIDEYCDITLDKFVATLKECNAEYNLKSVPDLTNKELDNIVEEVKKRYTRLKETNRNNFVDNMTKEDNDRKDRKVGFTIRKGISKIKKAFFK